MICKKCGLDISSDCILTGRPDVEGVCVFCHYNTNTWDSNGQLVTKDQATRGIGWFTAEELYDRSLDIIDKFEKYEDKCCTCFQGNAPCAKCENSPSEQDYDNAIKFVEDYERNM